MKQQKSQSVCLAPIGACLLKCDEVLKSSTVWYPNNQEQEKFMSEYFRPMRESLQFLPEIESTASQSADVINRFLRERGFQIQLPEMDPGQVGIASVFKLLLEWTKPGRIDVITDQYEKRHDAVRIRQDHDFLESKYAKNPIVVITTKSGDRVHMTAYDKPPTGLDFLDLIYKISAHAKPNYDYKDVVFPMVNYDEHVDISWIQGLYTKSLTGDWDIVRALQQTKFRMNEFGAKVESAVAMGVRFGFCEGGPPPKPDLIIDRPFLLWVTRDCIPRPVFIGHFTEEDWQRPESL